MNQILAIDNSDRGKEYKSKQKKSRGPVEISKILKFFSIILIVYGVLMIGTGSYSMYKNSQGSSSTKATIYMSEPIGTEITIKINHKKQLSKITYSWNGKNETEIDCAGKKKVEEKIQVPTGTNILTVVVTDINGQESKSSKTYIIEGDIKIELTPEGNQMKVSITGKDELSYFTYRWDDEEETKIEINDTSIEETIDIPKGLHTLTVIAVDINNTTETKEQDIQGVTRPKLEVTTDGGDNFIIRATDEEGLQKVEFIINEDEKYMLNLDGRTELEYAYPLHDGENKLEVTVYNVNDISETSRVRLNK